MSPKPKIVIVGASFAGVQAAHALETALENSVDITIIDKRSHRLHVLGSLRALVKSGFEDSIIIPYDKAFKTAKLVRGNVTQITPTEVHIENTNPITFDYLIIATGSNYNEPVKMEAQTKDDLVNSYKSIQEQIKQAKSFLILGGGPTGFEFIGELKEQYGKEKEITIVTSSDRLLSHLEPKQSARALNLVKSVGVNAIFNDKVASSVYDNTSRNYAVTTANGHNITVDFIFKAYGSEPNVAPIKDTFSSSLVPNVNGKLSLGVAKTLQVIKNSEGYDYETVSDVYPNIYAIGDISSTPETKMAARIPASVAVATKNIIKQVQGKTPNIKYTPMKGELMLASFGEKDGVVQLTLPVVGSISANFMSSMKSKDLFAPKYWKEHGYNGVKVA